MMNGGIKGLNLTIHRISLNDFDLLERIEDQFNVILFCPSFDPNDKSVPFKSNGQDDYVQNDYKWLNLAHAKLHKHGTLLVYSIPRWLPYYGEYLSKKMTFKYWIALKTSSDVSEKKMLPGLHEGILLYVNDKKKFTLNRVRYPHIFCNHCGDYIADWGGKKHLRPEYGPIVSDVWDDRKDFVRSGKLTSVTTSRLLMLTCKEGDRVLVIGDCELDHELTPLSFSQEVSSPVVDTTVTEIKKRDLEIHSVDIVKDHTRLKKDEIYIGDVIEVLDAWVKQGNVKFDLIFADPPYNLEKGYGQVNDDLADEEYIQWCDRWLALCAELLSPTGSMYVLNLPKWSIFHAAFLNRKLFFQRWIVWDALSDPRGKIMPAHYSLLLYTSDPEHYTYNRLPEIYTMDHCLRPKCVNDRNENDTKEPISDIWYDIHRIKHKRDRDQHPCQLPTKLLERIIMMSSNPGDIVLDPFMGTGTTAVVAKKLNRNFIGIDIDPAYKEIALSRLADLSLNKKRKDLNHFPMHSVTHQPPLFKD